MGGERVSYTKNKFKSQIENAEPSCLFLPALWEADPGLNSLCAWMPACPKYSDQVIVFSTFLIDTTLKNSFSKNQELWLTGLNAIITKYLNAD